QRATAPVSLWMIEAIDPQPGHTVLELAAGPGETGFLAAELIRPGGGRLISTDFAEPMVEVARARAEAMGLRNVELRTMDAESMDLDTAAVDRVLCRFGFMLMTDPAAALRETRRVLRPGGRLALAVWAPAQENPWASIAGRTVRARLGAPEPDPDAPSMFALGRPERLNDLLHDAGFADVRVEPLDFTQDYESFDDWLRITRDVAKPMADLFDAMDAEAREATLAEIREAFAPYAGPGGALAFPARALVAAAGA
ncbi:MAG TPA: methyltransferase domain-containing protein, partial [Solirubrobacteraceae bacterium]|nr:methyltransferase domain-containing protein [Solirubrobacteraceae bacterium]